MSATRRSLTHERPQLLDEFDDKLRFNQRFAKYLGRKTLNGETATLTEFTDFIAGQEAIFAKINHGDCGRGVNKLYVKDYESPAVMLDYIRRNQLVVLEQVLPQHPIWHGSIPRR